jgi:hypothetical protein
VAPGTAYSYSAVGLTENTTYYWRISAANEASPESGLLAGTQATSASSLLSGKKTVGPSGDYASLTDAITDMQLKGLAGNFELELLAAYNSSVETFPLIFTSINTSVSKTLTIYPHTDAVGLVISSDNYYKTIELFTQITLPSMVARVNPALQNNLRYPIQILTELLSGFTTIPPSILSVIAILPVSTILLQPV